MVIDGFGITVTVSGAEVLEQLSTLVTVTVYDPPVVATYVAAFAPGIDTPLRYH